MNIGVNIIFTILSTLRSAYLSIMRCSTPKNKKKEESNPIKEVELFEEEKEFDFGTRKSIKYKEKRSKETNRKKTRQTLSTLPAVLEQNEESSHSEENLNVFTAFERTQVLNKIDDSEEESDCFGKSLFIQDQSLNQQELEFMERNALKTNTCNNKIISLFILRPDL